MKLSIRKILKLIGYMRRKGYEIKRIINGDLEYKEIK